MAVFFLARKWLSYIYFKKKGREIQNYPFDHKPYAPFSESNLNPSFSMSLSGIQFELITPMEPL